MQAAFCRAAARQGDIQAIVLQAALEGCLADLFVFFGQGGFQGQFHLVGPLPNLRAVFFWKLGQAAENLHHSRAAPGVGGAPGL
jgi:hypothetical protein